MSIQPRVIPVVLSFLVALVVAMPAGGARAEDPQPIDGSNDACTDFRLQLLDLGFFDISFDIADEGWVWVANSQEGESRYQPVTGVVEGSNVARNDTPANHDSHDHGTHVKVDSRYRHLLSNANPPNTEDTVDSVEQFVTPHVMELEWEIGVFPDVRGNAAPEAYFPRWAWPSIGDRVYANGNWIFDCGHPKVVCHEREPQHNICISSTPYYHSEIHPPRVVAAMRNQAQVLPKSGTTPVPVTAVDLYIHGRAGYVNDILQCGMKTLIGEGECEKDPHPHRPTPIDDDYEFVVCLPPRLHADAILDWTFAAGPGNLVPAGTPAEPDDLDPQITVLDEVPPDCANASQLMDAGAALLVKIPLDGSGVGPDETYTRRIVAGWIDPPAPPLTHLNVAIDNIDLHDSEDEDSLVNPACSDDAEMTFFWANIDRAPSNEWLRFADFAPTFSNGNSVLNDYDPELFGHSFVETPGAGYDFYMRHGEPFTVRTNGYDQDCYDQHFGAGHDFSIVFPYIYCNASPFECFDGNNDELTRVEAEIQAPDYDTDPATGFGTRTVGTPLEARIDIFDPTDPIKFISDYELNLSIQKVALAQEDTSDLEVNKTCVPDTSLSFVCTVTIENPGPGLPRAVVVTDTLVVGGGATAVMEAPEATQADGTEFEHDPCTSQPPLGFRCEFLTVPVGSHVNVSVRVVASGPGDFDNTASVTSDSTDPDTGNNSETDGITVVAIDIKPRQFPNAINPADPGVVPVAILKTPTFDPAIVTPSSVCFGDSGDLSQRNCTEAHGTGHRDDVDRDRDTDLLLHYVVNQTGIDPIDSQACLSGETSAGRTIIGCDSIKTSPKVNESLALPTSISVGVR